MIQEILTIAQDFQRYGIQCSDLWHQHLPKCPKGKAYRVILNKDGSTRSIESFNEETWSGLRYYNPNNHRQFPSFKMASCLSKKIYDNAIQNIQNLPSTLQDIQKKIQDKDPSLKKAFHKFKNCLCECSHELTSQINEDNPVFKSLKDLSDAISKADIMQLYMSVLDYLLKNKDETSLTKAFYLGFEIHQEIFDANYIPVQHPKIFEEINKVLLKNQRAIKEDGKLDYLGNSAIGYEEPFRMTIGHIGNIGLFERNESSPMLERYGVNGKESFIIGNKSREYLMAPLQFLTAESRYNKTYKSLGKNRGKTVLAICYWDGITQFDTTAPLFCTTTDEDDQHNLITDFEKSSEDILKVFSEVIQRIPEAKFKIICIKVPSTGAAYVSYSKQLLVEGLIGATNEWIEGCKFLPRPSGNFYQSLLPSPIDFWRVINKKITLGKNGEYGVENYDYFSINEIFEFFLGNNSMLHKIAGVIANNHVKMLIYQREGKTDYEISKRIVPFVLSMIGLIVKRLQKTKESYMKELGYLIGEYCSVANQIQKLYFESRSPSKGNGNKKGRVPSRLLGSEHIQWFMIDPVKALNSLGQKLMVYRDWAQSNMKSIPYAGYCVTKLKEINEKLIPHHEELSKIRFNEMDKICLASSYYIGLTKLDKNTETKEETIEETPVQK